VKENLV